MDSRPNLTLSVIVKNEAELLSGLLSHHKHLYDEVVVVDTGSDDNSRQIALDAGVLLYDFPWQDDFSSARNHGLKHSTGQWILQLDCDERIDPKDFSELLDLAQQPANCCHTLAIHNYTSTSRGKDWCETRDQDRPWCAGAPGYWKTQPIRLFPNVSDLRFSGIIHENILGDVERTGLEVSHSNIVIHHTGLLCEKGRVRRDQLYGPLLKEKVRQSPEDTEAIIELVRYLAGRNELVVAEKLMTHFFNILPNADKEVHGHLLMIEIQTRLGKLEPALNRLNRTIREHPDQLLCWIQAVVLQKVCNKPELACAYLEQGRKLFPLSPVLKQLENGFSTAVAAQSSN